MSFCSQAISSLICCFHLHLSCLATSVTLPSSVCLTQSWCLWPWFLAFFAMPQRWFWFCFGSRSFLTLLLFLKIIFAGICCWKSSRHPGVAVDQWCLDAEVNILFVFIFSQDIFWAQQHRDAPSYCPGDKPTSSTRYELRRTCGLWVSRGR